MDFLSVPHAPVSGRPSSFAPARSPVGTPCPDKPPGRKWNRAGPKAWISWDPWLGRIFPTLSRVARPRKVASAQSFVPVRSSIGILRPGEPSNNESGRAGPRARISVSARLGWGSRACRAYSWERCRRVSWPSGVPCPGGPPDREFNGAGPKARTPRDPWPGWISQARRASYIRARGPVSSSAPIRPPIGTFCPAKPSNKAWNPVGPKAWMFGNP